jgi:hypothetical protein
VHRSSESVRFINEHTFIKELVSQVQSGYGLVPFIGSGCSAPSGILMGQQFHDYLAWTVALCVADRKKWPIFKDRWDLRTDGWPRPPTHADLKATRAWAMEGFCYIAKASGFDVGDNPATNRVRSLTQLGNFGDPASLARLLYAPLVPPFLRDAQARQVEITDGNAQRDLHRLLTENGLLHGGLLLPGVSFTSEDAIAERAIRSLYDWRSTLHFLSSLKLGANKQTLFLEEPEHSVIDNFNVHITRGKRPNLIHSMLCHLRQPARLRLLLTTNFDTLIEDAFASQNRRVEVISVSVRGALPDPEVVHARDTVVKLHGTFSETRADFSLDLGATPEDRRRFFHYVRGSYPERTQPGFVPSQLLVAGYSGSDARCVDMMKTVLEGDPAARIFWICNSKRDKARLTEIFCERSYGRRVVATVSERVDLLLYEFQQQLCLTLPPGGGSSYHITHNVAPVASFRLDEGCEEAPAPGVRLLVEAASWIGDRSPAAQEADAGANERKILVVDGPSGALVAMRGAMDFLAQQHGVEKVWLELEDYADTPSLAHDLLQIIASRRGALNLGHAELCPSELLSSAQSRTDSGAGARLTSIWTQHIAMLQEYLNIDPTRWVIGLYGRNGPGGCTGWKESTLFWDAKEYGGLGKPSPFLAFLIGLKNSGFTVIYAPYSRARLERDEQRKLELRAAIDGSDSLKASVSPKEVDDIVNAGFVFPRTPHDLESEQQKTDYARFWLGDASSSKSSAGQAAVSYPWQLVCLSSDLNQASANRFPNTVRQILRHALHLDQDDLAAAAGRTAGVAGAKPRSFWRFNLLYGASLMRQSRHYSSFFSEGVLQCPLRFNLQGYDNDWLRHTSLEELLDTLDREPRVFLRKPGGFAWLYRDTRQAMRCLVEVASIAASTRPTASERDKISDVRKFKARAHTNIADWYLRAFFVSGNASPLMEAAYHYFSSIIAAPEAHRNRQALWRRGLHQLVKTLRRGDLPLRLWFGRGQLATWFVDPKSDSPFSPEELRRQIKESWDKVVERDQAEANRPIGRDINATDKEVLQLLVDELTQLRRLVSAQAPVFSFLSLQGVEAGVRAAESPESQAPVSRKSDSPTVASLERLDLDQDDWWNSDGTPQSVKDLMPTLSSVTAGRPEKWEKKLLALREKLHNDPALAAKTFQELVEWTYQLVSRAKRCEHGVRLLRSATANGSPVEESVALEPRGVAWETRRLLSPENVREAWMRVCLFANAVVDASHWIAPGIDVFINFEVSKVLGLYGIALARLGRFYEAHRRLNHAEAILVENSQPNSQARIGVLELRRGEAYVLEAMLVHEVARAVGKKVDATDGIVDSLKELRNLKGAEPDDVTHRIDDIVEKLRAQQSARRSAPAAEALFSSVDDGLKEVRRRLAAVFKDEDPKRESATWMWVEPQVKAILETESERTLSSVSRGLRRIVVARCGDAWGCFERCEALLAGESHSALWWSRLRALQLLTLSITPKVERAPYRPMSTRVRVQPALLSRLWREGIAAAPQDWYNRLRLLDYYVRALNAFGVADDESVSKELQHCKTARTDAQDGTELQDKPDFSSAHIENLEWRIANRQLPFASPDDA